MSLWLAEDETCGPVITSISPQTTLSFPLTFFLGITFRATSRVSPGWTLAPERASLVSALAKTGCLVLSSVLDGLVHVARMTFPKLPAPSSWWST